MDKEDAYKIILAAKLKMAAYTLSPTLSTAQYMRLIRSVQADLGINAVREIMDRVEDTLDAA